MYFTVVLRSHAFKQKLMRILPITKIDENFANYFLKTIANNKCFHSVKCTCKGLQKSINKLER